MYLCELSGSKFHSVTTCSSNVILYNDVKNFKFSSKVDLSGFGTELFNYRQGKNCVQFHQTHKISIS